MSLTELIHQETDTLFEVVGEGAFQPAAVVVEESPEAFSSTLLPLSLEDRLDGPSLLALKPVVAPQTPGRILSPLSLISLHSGVPAHHAVPFLLVFFPSALILVSRLVFHLSMAMSQTSLEFSLENCPICKAKHSPALLYSLTPLSFVARAIDRAVVLSRAMSTPLDYASRVVTSIGPSQLALPSYRIIADLPFIQQSTLPSIQSLPVHEAIPEPTCV